MNKLLFLSIMFISCIACNINKDRDVKANDLHRKVDSIQVKIDSICKSNTISDTGYYETFYPVNPTTTEAINLYRYFLISYKTREIGNFNNTIDGDVFFPYLEGFPSKPLIDSIVYSGFEMKRKCYDDVVIVSIYEFKSKEDYNCFCKGYVNKHTSTKKRDCHPCYNFDPGIGAEYHPFQGQVRWDTCFGVLEHKFDSSNVINVDTSKKMEHYFWRK